MKLMPQVCASPASKRRVRNGIASSAYQPLATMRVLANQRPSQLTLVSRPSFTICASHFAPIGLIANM